MKEYRYTFLPLIELDFLGGLSGAICEDEALLRSSVGLGGLFEATKVEGPKSFPKSAKTIDYNSF